MRRGLLAIATATTLGLWTLHTPTRADFVISIADQTIAPGGTAVVDVTIRSDNPAGDPLTGFGFEFLITPAGGGSLQFVDPQADSQLTQPDYVFAGNSADLAGGDPVGVVSSSGGGTNNRFVGGDSTEDASDVTVASDPFLLVRLNLTAALGTTPLPGQSFTIALENSPFTSFDSNAGPIPYSSTPGLVMIVPEPSSSLLLAGLLGALALKWGTRSRQRES